MTIMNQFFSKTQRPIDSKHTLRRKFNHNHFRLRCQTQNCSLQKMTLHLFVPTNSSYFGCPKNTKRFYEQVWFVWWLRYSKKLTCNKFEVSDFLNFEKILKIRWKTQKRVIFTKMLFSLRRVKTALVKVLPENTFCRKKTPFRFLSKFRI